MTVSFKVSDNIKEKMIEYYEDLKREKTPAYAVFQANEADTVITLYESGKVVFQGMSADIDANMWIDQEKHLNNRDVQDEIDANNKKKEEKKEEEKDYRFYNISSVGSDEVGTGDYFGPIVVTASFVDKKNILKLQDLGVKDSKMITDDKIRKIAPPIIKLIPHTTFILDNVNYNKNKIFNMNKVKAILHNKVLVGLLKKEHYNYEKIVVDQFVYPKKYFEHINNTQEKVTNITFTTHAENKCFSVAVSSIISRYIFLQEMDKLSKEYNMIIPKGASIKVDEAGKELVKKYGKEVLYKIAKINFKNTDKIL